MAELSPMMQQYMRVKQEHEDQILFYRIGDFYEMFFDDAKVASRELELVLTGKDCGLEDRAPMCGVPYHSCEAYIARLVAKGYKVAICEQTEDPAKAKGLVRREVIRVVTPGTVIEGSMLDESKNNYIASIYIGATVGFCFADISTGEVFLTELTTKSDGDMINEVARFVPSEVLLGGAVTGHKAFLQFIKDKLQSTLNIVEEEDFALQGTMALVKSHFSDAVLEATGMLSHETGVRTLGALITYLGKTQMTGLERLTTINFYHDKQYMDLDLTARRNLELTQTMRTGEKKGSLLGVLDQTKTAMGKRLIRKYIEQPLLNGAIITRRLNAVEELVGDAMLRGEVCECLHNIYDLERLMTRIVYGTATPRELNSLAFTLQKLPGVRALLKDCTSQELSSIYQEIDELQDVAKIITDAIIENPPITAKDGGIIQDGFDPQVDELREIINGGKGFLADIEAREREATGIKNLKIGYNKVFGYFLEVTRSYLDLVPDTYIRKQTLTGAERFITQELKELEAKVLGANEKIIALELELLAQVRTAVANELYRIQNTAMAIAKLDVYASFAQVAFTNNYVRPEISLDGEIRIQDGRHPVVETLLTDSLFVPNDTYMDNKGDMVAIITGPNMAGKSTYMRQVALIVLMAQIGCFVPARAAKVAIVDRIFTRVGASDDLAAGQSTFMVEMNEVAEILKNATSKSLLILDEIGRGTSTYDGMSIARAVVEYIANKKKIGAKTLFATHYHELTQLEDILPGVVNYNIAVKKHGDDITFLRRIVRGGTDDSYGIEVAKLAGIPGPVVKRAFEILYELEKEEGKAELKEKMGSVIASVEEDPQQEQLSLGSMGNSEVIRRLQNLDVNTLTPIEAMNTLFELAQLAK